jgi:hypothetical protein
MILIILLVGIVLVVAAFRNSQGALFSALGTDVPHFMVIAAAIFAVGAIGFIPGLKPVSRGLLALVILVIVFQNYQNMLAGFKAVWTVPAPVTAPSAATGSTNSITQNNFGLADIFNQFGGSGSLSAVP